MNMSLNIMRGIYDAIASDEYSCHSYYIIRFSSPPYTLQADLSIDNQVTFSGDILSEGTYFFPININSH